MRKRDRHDRHDAILRFSDNRVHTNSSRFLTMIVWYSSASEVNINLHLHGPPFPRFFYAKLKIEGSTQILQRSHQIYRYSLPHFHHGRQAGKNIHTMNQNECFVSVFPSPIPGHCKVPGIARKNQNMYCYVLYCKK
jgi:hypothetical protein